MKPFNRLLSFAALLALSLSFAACDPLGLIDILDDDDDKETPVTPSNPETPTDKNTVTVTPNGTKVTRGDFSINFPSGTFTKDVQVTVTNVTAGDVYGDLEVSKFYKVKMPVTTNKSSTIRIKSEKLDDDVVFIRRAESWARSAGKSMEIGNVLEATYVDGEYKVTLPVYNNGEETERAEFTIGLAHPVKLDETRAGVTTRSSETAVAEGQVKDVKWKVYIDPKAKKVTNSWKVLTTDEITKVNGYIKEAITKILDLGFELKDKNRVIPFYYVSDPNRWGFFSQGYFNDKDSWIGISVEHLVGRPNESTPPKSTLIHEIFHYFQSDYDPRCAWDKKGGTFGMAVDNENILYEMGAVWMEQWMRGGQLDNSFIKQEFNTVFGDINGKNGDKLGFGLEEQRWGLGKHDSNQKQGYIMAPYLYYITTEWGSIFNKKSVLELHKLWNKKWKSSTYNSYYIFYDWVKNMYDTYLLDFTDIDNYYLKLWTGNLVKEFYISELESFAAINNLINQNTAQPKFTFEGKCYPYGCGAQKVVVMGFENVSVADKELVVKQENDNVHTYLMWYRTTTGSYDVAKKDDKPFGVLKGDSIVITSEELERLRNPNGKFLLEFFLMTTNTANSIHSTKVNPYRVTFELRDKVASVNPGTLYFNAEGGTQSLKVTAPGYKRFGFTIINSDPVEWLSATAATGGTITVKAQPNTSHEARTGHVKCFVSNVENASEEQKVYLPLVKVTQAGSQESGEGDITVTKIGYATFEGSFMTQEVWTGYDTTVEHDPEKQTYSDMVNSNISFSVSGSTLHVAGNSSLGTKKISMSFDVINFTGNCSGSKVKNLKYATNDKYSDLLFEVNLSLDNIAAKSGFKPDTVPAWATLHFETTEAKGLNVISFSDIYYDENTFTNRRYISESNNSASLDLYFYYVPKSRSSIPRRRDSLPTMPWTSHGEAELR